MEKNNNGNPILGLIIVLVIAGLVGVAVWGITHMTLGRKISSLYKEKMTVEELLKNKDKEKDEALEKTVMQYKSIIEEKERDAGSKKNGLCMTGQSFADIEKIVDKKFIDLLLAEKEIGDNQAKIEYIEWCNFREDTVRREPQTFVLGGNFGKENNIIGLIVESDEGSSIVFDQQFNADGVCGTTGFIDGNLIYACGATVADSASQVYILHKESGKSTLLKSCEYRLDKKTEKSTAVCSKNILNLAE